MKELWKKIEKIYDHGDPSHDVSHLRRVMSTCRRLGQAEGADLSILLPAVLLHDLINVPKNHPDREKASQLAAEKAKGFLIEAGYGDDQVSRIAQVIVEHSFSAGRKATSLESAILQDADRLDALGAVGIMRTVTCGAKMGATYYHLDEPFSEVRNLDDKKFTLDHFFVKLLKLPELMNTKSARVEAEKRASFMREFLQQLREEIGLGVTGSVETEEDLFSPPKS